MYQSRFDHHELFSGEDLKRSASTIFNNREKKESDNREKRQRRAHSNSLPRSLRRWWQWQEGLNDHERSSDEDLT